MPVPDGWLASRALPLELACAPQALAAGAPCAALALLAPGGGAELGRVGAPAPVALAPDQLVDAWAPPLLLALLQLPPQPLPLPLTLLLASSPPEPELEGGGWLAASDEGLLGGGWSDAGLGPDPHALGFGG